MSTDDICRTCGKPGAVEMRCRRLPCIWADTVAAAVDIDMLTVPGSNQTGPAVIEAVIISTHDRASSGSSYDSEMRPGARMEPCDDRTCPAWHPDYRHDHPVPVDPTGDAAMRPSVSEADLSALRDDLSAFVTAVGHLGALFDNRPPATTWAAALNDAIDLNGKDAVGILESTGFAPRRWVNKAGDAVMHIEYIRQSNPPNGRAANDWERSATGGFNENDACKVCIQMGLLVDARRDKGGRGGLCQGCNRLRKRCAEANEIDTADAPEPPVELVEELRRIGSPNSVADQAARSRWFQRVGDDIRGRRSA